MTFTTLAWEGTAKGRLRLLDQTLLPETIRDVVVGDVETLFDAITRLVVRGAPAIGIAAAYGPVLSWQAGVNSDEPAESLNERIRRDYARLLSARPTAVSLQWSLDRMMACLDALQARGAPSASWGDALLAEAQRIDREEADRCLAMAQHCQALLRDGMRVLTHCNSGRLATSGIGTALGAIFEAAEQGKRLHVTHTETRPLLQGARLTNFELQSANIDCELVLDAAAPSVIAAGDIDAVLVGADRISARGDVANKIGTYPLALAANASGVPFYVVAPLSTVDLETADGSDIAIEERSPAEILDELGSRVPPNCKVRNPAFDVTPHHLVTSFVCERGALGAPLEDSIKRAISNDR